MKLPLAFFAVVFATTSAFANPNQDFLALIKRNDTAKSLSEKESALVTAGERALALIAPLKACESQKDILSKLEEGDSHANATLASCCASIIDAGAASVALKAILPLLNLSIPELKTNKMMQDRADAATYVAEQVLNLSLYDQKKLIEATVDSGFEGTISICRAAMK